MAEKAMAPHSNTLAWKIPWMEEPGGLQSMGSLRVGHGWATSLSLFTFMHWRRKWQPTPVSCLENPRDGGSWLASIYGIAQSWTRLKRLSSSSSSSCLLASVWLMRRMIDSVILVVLSMTYFIFSLPNPLGRFNFSLALVFRNLKKKKSLNMDLHLLFKPLRILFTLEI